MLEKVLILGSGPAGYTAALYAARANLQPLLLQGYQPGGQLTITTDVENFPGFPEGVQGPELMEKMQKQAERFGARMVTEQAEKVELAPSFFRVKSDKGEYQARALIVCTGAQAKLLGLEKEKELMGYGVSACATCDGFFFKGKEIAVVGGGDSAIEEATYLTKFAQKVTVIHRRDTLRASKIMQERAFANPKIAFKWNRVVRDIVGTREQGVEALCLASTNGGKEEKFPCEGLFLAIGHKPNTSIVQGLLKLDPQGYICTYDGTTQTSVRGIFAAGDVVDFRYRQAVTAAGMGCQAALDVEKFLEEVSG